MKDSSRSYGAQGDDEGITIEFSEDKPVVDELYSSLLKSYLEKLNNALSLE